MSSVLYYSKYCENCKKVLFELGKSDISKQIQRLLSSIFGETITINDLRKSHTTYFSENKSVKQQRQLADQMLHTYGVSSEYYVRNELNKKK